MAVRSWIPTVCVGLAVIACATAFALELVVLFGIHGADFDVANKDALGNVTADRTCVGAAPKERVSAVYGVDGAPASYGGLAAPADVGCSSAEGPAAVPRKDLQRLVAASVHGLRKAAADAGDGASLELRATYAAARDAALGVAEASAASVGFWQAVGALRALEPPPRTCGEIYAAAPAALGGPPRDAAVVSCTVNVTDAVGVASADAADPTAPGRLHTHCLEQHSIARYQPYSEGLFTWNTGGTLGIPAHGVALTPAWQPAPWLVVEDDADATARARALYGLRFGWKATVGVAALILAVFALVDAAFFLFAHLTLPARLKAVGLSNIDGGGDAEQTVQPMIIVLATIRHVRTTRFFAFAIGWILVIVLRGVYAWSTWDFGMRLPRTDCATGTGWVTDDASAWYEALSTALLLFALIVTPVAQSRALGRTAAATDAPAADGVTAYTKRNARSVQICFWALALVSLLFLAWEVALTMTWGYGWSASILTPDGLAVANTTWTTAEYGEATYASVVRTTSFGVFMGVLLALVLSRWLFATVTPQSFYCSVLWVFVAIGAFVPMFISFGLNFDVAIAPERCQVFPSAEPVHWLCASQPYMYLVLLIGALALLGVLWVPWMLGSATAALCSGRTYYEVGPQGMALVNDAIKQSSGAASAADGRASILSDREPAGDATGACAVELDEFQRLPLLSLRAV